MFLTIQHVKLVARRVYDRFIKLKGAPREIALGFALGIVIGMTPLLGIHILSCVMLASLLGWSKIAAVVGVNITNVITAPLIYPLNYWVGLRLAGTSKGVEWSMVTDYSQALQMMKQSPLILVDLFIGGMILGFPIAIAGYFIVLKIVRLYRKRRVVCASDHC